MDLYAFWKNGTNGFTIEAYRISHAWNEQYTDQDYYDNGIRWTRAGGDYGAKVATFNSPSGYDVPKTDRYTMTTAVQNAVSNPASNFGWLLIDVAGSDGHGYYTSQYGTQSQRPKLTVTYTAPTSVAVRGVVTSGAKVNVVSGVRPAISWKSCASVAALVYDGAGRRAGSWQLRGQGHVDLSNLRAGSYVVRISGDGMSEVRGLVVQ